MRIPAAWRHDAQFSGAVPASHFEREYLARHERQRRLRDDAGGAEGEEILAVGQRIEHARRNAVADLQALQRDRGIRGQRAQHRRIDVQGWNHRTDTRLLQSFIGKNRQGVERLDPRARIGANSRPPERTQGMTQLKFAASALSPVPFHFGTAG